MTTMMRTEKKKRNYFLFFLQFLAGLMNNSKCGQRKNERIKGKQLNFFLNWLFFFASFFSNCKNAVNCVKHYSVLNYTKTEELTREKVEERNSTIKQSDSRKLEAQRNLQSKMWYCIAASHFHGTVRRNFGCAIAAIRLTD